jgi:hypothetical protein
MGQIPRTLRDTLRGSGFLREAPQNVRALMRRCMVMPHRQVLGSPVVPVTHRNRSYPSFEWSAQLPEAPSRSNPPAQPDTATAPGPVPPPRAEEPKRAQPRAPDAAPEALPVVRSRPWWDDPVTIGALLIVIPPIGFAALWASRHYGKEGRWAISGMMALMLSLLTAVVVAFTLR